MVPRVFLLLLLGCDQVLVDGQVSELIIGSRANALGDIKVTLILSFVNVLAQRSPARMCCATRADFRTCFFTEALEGPP